MSWDARWKALADAVADLRGRGESIPPNVMRDLRSAKTMIEIIKVNRLRPEHASRLEECLSNVETYVLSAAESRFGAEYVNSLLRRLYEAERIRVEAEIESQVSFHPGLPREKKWIRIQPTPEVPLETIGKIAGEIGLESRVQEDGYVLIFGEEEKLKAFIKKMTEIFHASGKIGSKT